MPEIPTAAAAADRPPGAARQWVGTGRRAVAAAAAVAEAVAVAVAVAAGGTVETADDLTEGAGHGSSDTRPVRWSQMWVVQPGS